MKAMLWKELRENFKWAVLAMIGLGLAEFYGLMVKSNFYDDATPTLLKPSFLMATTFGCAAVGLVLGLIQILPELRRDQWAALLHRPVTRTTIYCGKAFAGILLYFLATLPPFLACIWYSATPGHFNVPFVAQTICPGIADLCAGLMYYLAALFVGLHRGAWYGTRAFGFLAAVVVSFYVTVPYIPLFRLPLEASLLMSLSLFVAGCGAIATNGKFGDQPRPAQLALLAVIFYGVCGLGTVGVMLLSMFSPPDYYYGTQYEVDIDGRPLKITSSKNSGSTITDLAGNVIKDERFNSASRYNFLLSFSQLSTFIGDRHGIERGRPEGYRQNYTYLIQAGGSFDNETESWYYLPLQRQFVGYFFKTNQRIGSIGQNGFRPQEEPVEPFTENISGSAYWQVSEFVQIGSTVYHNDFDQRKITPVFSPEGATVFGSEPLQSNQDRSLGLKLGAIALLDKLMVVDKTGQTVATLPYHQDMDHYGTVSVAIMPAKDRYFLHYQPSQWIDYEKQCQMSSYFEEMDTKGALLNTYTLPPLPEPHFHRTWQQYIVESLQTPTFFYGDMIYAKVGALCGSKRLASQLKQAFGRGWNYTRDIAIRITTVSLVLAALTYLWARRMHFSPKRAWAWAAFVLGFNLAGLITFRLVADWPVRVSCPECKRPRQVEENLCLSCGQTWPVQKPDGCEIFDSPLPS